MPSTHTSHRYVVILAGGSGHRLWPLSRAKSPKQFLKLFGGKSSFQSQYERALELVPKEHIFVGAPPEYVQYITDEVPALAKENIILKRKSCDTGVSTYLISARIAERDPKAVVLMLWSDHIVESQTSFVQSMYAAFAAAEQHPDRTILVGTKPLRPHTGLGYIRYGKHIETQEGLSLNEVAAFEEKPDRFKAELYLRLGSRLWNTGYQVFAAQALCDRIAIHTPHVYQVCKNVALLEQSATELHPVSDEALAEYGALEKVSFEHLFSSKLPFYVLKAEFEWFDMGDWKTVRTVVTKLRSGAEEKNHVLLRSPNSTVIGSTRLVALYGVKDVIVVDTDDALLIVDRNLGRNTKELVEYLKAHGYEGYF